LTRGNITELPVSVSVPLDGAAGGEYDAEAGALDAGALDAADVLDAADGLELDELLHAAASSATGIRVAAV
jgi:hypothetical protein